MIGKSIGIRKPCSVPGCSRLAAVKRFATSSGDIDGEEVICRDHWRLVPQSLKAVYRRATREFIAEPGVNLKRWNRLWARCKRIAIERSLGI